MSATQSCIIPAKGKGIVHTGLVISFPPGLYGRIAPRFGLAVKKFIDVGAGVIDQDYRGEICVVLFNHSETDFEVKQGDRIAQLILEKIKTPVVQEVQNLGSTERGIGGFGSTGIGPRNEQFKNNMITVSMQTNDQDSDRAVSVKFIVPSEPDSSRVNSLTRLSKSNKPCIKSQTIASRKRDIVLIRSIKKMAKQKIPMYVAIVRQIRPVQGKYKRERINKSVYSGVTAQGRTEGTKRQEMKLKGPKKDFKSVQEKEQELI